MTLLRRAVYDDGDESRSFLSENGLLIDEINLLSCWGKLVLISEPLSAEATDDVRGTIAVRCLVVCWIILDDADSTALLFMHAVDNSADIIGVHFCCFDCGVAFVRSSGLLLPSSTPFVLW